MSTQTNPTNASSDKPVVLVATDLRETGRRAVRQGLRTARRSQSDLHIVYIIDPGRFDGAAGDLRWLDQQLEESPARLREHVGEVLLADNVQEQHVTLHVRVGAPADALVQTSIDLKANLIVVGTARRRGLEKLFLGSVAQEVLRLARCPVFVALEEDYEGTQASPKVQAAMNDEEKALHERFSRSHRETHVYTPTHQWGSGRPTGVRIV